MQISRIYCNYPDIFEPISFNFGVDADRLNVVLAEVRKPKNKKLDSHNLGKTTLLTLIDFLCLKGLSPEHFLAKNADTFKDFVFFIEIALNDGQFATIRRSVSEPTRIALTKSANSNADLSEEKEETWDHWAMPIDEAIALLDAWLDLRVLKPYDYRQAITYFLRSQDDWSDELQLKKFQIGKDIYWKPFVAHLFGFDQNPVKKKYELDDRIKKLKSKQSELEAEVSYREDDLTELIAKIAVLDQQIIALESELNAFAFDTEERRIFNDLVETVEQEIAALNTTIYNLKYDIRQIDNSLSHKDKFVVDDVAAIFADANLYFPGQLRKDYEALVEFKAKITRERKNALRGRRKTLLTELAKVETRKKFLDETRSQQLRTLQNTDTFTKFKALQKQLSLRAADLYYLNSQREKLEKVAEIARQVRESDRERGGAIDQIKAMIARPTPIYERFAKTFNEYCQHVLQHEGMFFFRMNSSNNLEYVVELELAGQKGKSSNQGDGNSYKKMICALFDLALLKVYENASFFRFVYHDGMFEAFDDRKKLSFLELVREQTASCKLEYIMTTINSDLPRTAGGKLVKFPDEEIVLRLHDDGPSGRLFKMGEF